MDLKRFVRILPDYALPGPPCMHLHSNVQEHNITQSKSDECVVSQVPAQLLRWLIAHAFDLHPCSFFHYHSYTQLIQCQCN